MIYRVLATATLIALAVAGLLLLSSEQSSLAPPAPGTVQLPDPGYSARNATLIETGPDGQPMYTVVAQVVHQQPDSQQVTLDGVQLRFRDPKAQIWNGSSDRGLIVNDAAQVEMLGNVKLWGLLPGSDQLAHVSTDWLRVNTQTEVVSTQAPVAFDWNRQHLQGRGMTLHLKSSQLRLQSDVHGQFLP
jgi:LPS export ABC transporter protein LptC